MREYDLADALWVALIVVLTLWVLRVSSGYLVSRDNKVAKAIGSAIGGIVG